MLGVMIVHNEKSSRKHVAVVLREGTTLGSKGTMALALMEFLVLSCKGISANL